MELVIVGIDPGIDGAIVAVRDGKIIYKKVMPMQVVKGTKTQKDKIEFDTREICRIIMGLKKQFPDIFFITEQLQPIMTFRVGAWQTFKLGMAYQAVIGCLRCCDVPWVQVIPRVWTHFMWESVEPIYDMKKKPNKKGERKLDSKKMSKEVFNLIYPNEDIREVGKSGKPSIKSHDGFMDGALLAEYALRKKFWENSK